MLEAHRDATCLRRGQSMGGSQRLHLMPPLCVRGHASACPRLSQASAVSELFALTAFEQTVSPARPVSPNQSASGTSRVLHISANTAALGLAIRSWVSRSTLKRPKRLVYPSAHS